jgi:hypothetical protein
VRCCLLSTKIVNEEAMALWGLLRKKKHTKKHNILYVQYLLRLDFEITIALNSMRHRNEYVCTYKTLPGEAHNSD